MSLKARVENGRLKLDEPTDLPEGQFIELIPLDEVISTEGDDLDDEERAALHRSIDESIDDERTGNVEDLSKIIADFERSCKITGSAMTTPSDSSKSTPAPEADELTLLLEAARRATWVAKHGPAHLRSGRFFIAAHLDAHASSRLVQSASNPKRTK